MAFETKTLMVLPWMFVPDWFMEDVVETEVLPSVKSETQKKLIRQVSEDLLGTLAAYMKENGLFFAREPVDSTE